MNISNHIAWRYLFSHKSQNAINVIAKIAMAGIGVGAFAMVVVLSAFNGLETLVASLYSNFEPDIRISAIKGKTFDFTTIDSNYFADNPEVAAYSKVLEEVVMLKYNDKQTFATLKGVENSFLGMSQMESLMYDGKAVLQMDEQQFAIMGYGIAYQLEFFINQFSHQIQVFAANKEVRTLQNPANAFISKSITASGIFAINPDVDYTFFVVPFEFAQSLFKSENNVSAIELTLIEGVNHQNFKEKLQNQFGEDFQIKTRFEHNEILYKTNQTEKWVTFFILSFILLIAVFNIIGSLTMLIIEKRKDILVMKSLGGSLNFVRATFFKEGLLIAVFGGGIGIFVGVILVLLQNYFGLIPLQGAIVEHYPVELRLVDIIAVSVCVVGLGSLGAIAPVVLILKKYYRSSFSNT